MENLTIESIREIQLEILDKVSEFCELEGIDYYLAYGTLLGAIRHRGYIPWDDDIDIVIRRDQYETFLTKFNEINSRYKVYSCFNNDWFPYAFAKVSDETTVLIEENDEMKENIGINIDIFPLDELPLSNRNNFTIKFLTKVLVLKSVKINSKRQIHKNMILLLGKFITKFITSNWIARKINELAKTKSEHGLYLGNIVYTDSSSDYADRKAFETKTVTQFEDREYSIPEGYDVWLKNYYGNYMQLPPEEKRITHHEYIATKKVYS